jgi:hypothetical protein
VVPTRFLLLCPGFSKWRPSARPDVFATFPQPAEERIVVFTFNKQPHGIMGLTDIDEIEGLSSFSLSVE